MELPYIIGGFSHNRQNLSEAALIEDIRGAKAEYERRQDTISTKIFRGRQGLHCKFSYSLMPDPLDNDLATPSVITSFIKDAAEVTARNLTMSSAATPQVQRQHEMFQQFLNTDGKRFKQGTINIYPESNPPTLGYNLQIVLEQEKIFGTDAPVVFIAGDIADADLESMLQRSLQMGGYQFWEDLNAFPTIHGGEEPGMIRTPYVYVLEDHSEKARLNSFVDEFTNSPAYLETLVLRDENPRLFTKTVMPLLIEEFGASIVGIKENNNFPFYASVFHPQRINAVYTNRNAGGSGKLGYIWQIINTRKKEFLARLPTTDPEVLFDGYLAHKTHKKLGAAILTYEGLERIAKMAMGYDIKFTAAHTDEQQALDGDSTEDQNAKYQMARHVMLNSANELRGLDTYMHPVAAEIVVSYQKFVRDHKIEFGIPLLDDYSAYAKHRFQDTFGIRMFDETGAFNPETRPTDKIELMATRIQEREQRKQQQNLYLAA